jgi:hypothetical protein
MGMSQDELKIWADAQKKKKDLKPERYEVSALMNFRSYLGGMTKGLKGPAIQLLWARSLAYDLYSQVQKNHLGAGGWYSAPLLFSYDEGSNPKADPPTVFKGKEGAKQGQLTGAGQCAYFMQTVGNALKPMAGLKTGQMAVLGCYHKGWKHNFVILAPDANTMTAADVVMFDGWALAFGVNPDDCWGVKADESWLAGVWQGISIEQVYQK